jgi:hypothetical protein
MAFGLWGHDHPTTARAAGLTATPSGRSAIVVPGFDSFADQVKTLTDSVHLFVESNGMPAHRLMVGIRSWQQQLPLPQDYTGLNAWRLPVNPVLAANPISAKTALYRGAIALAVNGVPIFNALNNRGADAYLVGELDEFGGHSGRADDYHYHMAPLHLQSIVGPSKPIAYGLDGYPLYGLTEPDGSTVTDLDQFNGHFGKDGHYHYHGTERYPYLNGGMRGVVSVVGDQVDPQPYTTPVRPSLQPLNGATITDFQVKGTTSYALAYQISGKTYYVNYNVQGTHYTFTFVDPTGKTRTETYTQSQQPPPQQHP